MNKVINRLGKFLMVSALIANSIAALSQPAEASTSNPDVRGRVVGYLDSNKKVQDSYENYISGWSIGSDSFNLTFADVKWSGAVSGGGSSYKVANYSKATETSNNGYPIVDMNEALAYARLFNGNPAFMNNANGLYGGDITGGGGSDYTGYLLAQVAEMSGGSGGPYEFRSTTGSEQGSFVGVTNFRTTQRPDGMIKTDKTKYDVGATVTITSSGKDYSIYNRGLKVYNLYIYNVDTGNTEKSFTAAIKDYPIAGAGDGVSGTQVTFPTQTWTPMKAGNYEARVLFTDSHARNTKNAPAVDGAGVAYSYAFTVGDPTSVPPGGGGGTGPVCDAGDVSNKMDIFINADEGSNRNLTSVPSNSATIMVGQNDRVFFTFKTTGKFYVNGSPLPTPSSGDRKQGVWDVPAVSFVTYTITFESDDGSNCWTQKFQAKGSGNEKECPAVKDSTNYNRATTVMNGAKLTSYLLSEVYYHADNTVGGNFTVFERDPDDGTVYPGGEVWLVMYPGQTTWTKINGTSAHATLNVGSSGLSFTKGGTYKVKIDFENGMNSDLDCVWEVTIEVKNCKIDWGNGFTYYGAPPNTTPAQIVHELVESIGPVDYRQITDVNGDLKTNIVFKPPMPGKYYEVRGGSRIPISSSIPASTPHVPVIPGGYNYYSPGDTITIVFVPDDGVTCEVIFKISTAEGNTGGGSGKCYVVEMTYGGKTINPRSAAIPFKITKADLNGDYKIYFKFAKKASLWVGWYNPQGVTGSPTYQHLRSDSKDVYDSYFTIPQDKNGDIESLIYKASWWSRTKVSEDGNDPCEGEIVIQVEGDKSPLENLYVDPVKIMVLVCREKRGDIVCSSTYGPPKPGDSVEVTTYYGNEGKFNHKPLFWTRWKDGKWINSNNLAIKTHEYAQKFVSSVTWPSTKQIFTTCINVKGQGLGFRADPTEESTWDDNCAEWEFSPDGSVGPIGGSKENLAVDPDYFVITPKDPQDAGTAAQVEVKVSNKGDSEHSSKVLLKFDGETKSETVNVTLKAGETKSIKVSVIYPTKSMNFTANINPDKNMPTGESTWNDNKGSWPVLVNGSPPPGGGGGGGTSPGGPIDGGQMTLNIYDSDNRKLTSAADGVWEREPARVEVIIDQAKIDDAFNNINNQINNAIQNRISEFQSQYSPPDYESVDVQANPTSWNSKTNSMTKRPPSVNLHVTGLGGNQDFQLDPEEQQQSSTYTLTTVPTSTTWRQVLNSPKYKAKVDDFQIIVDYKIDFDVSYEECEEPDPDDPDAEKVCTPGNDSDTLQNTFTITVKGTESDFEVFEPNFKLTLHHTPEWTQIHAKDEYTASTNKSYYAGEAILTHVDLEDRHKHPVSGKYPVILAGKTWMQETGGVAAWMKRTGTPEHPYVHTVTLSLVPASEILWRGPLRNIPDPNKAGSILTNREKGVDNGLGRRYKTGPITMGDMWYGLQPGETYWAWGEVQFKFGVTKGYAQNNKSTSQGSQSNDYKSDLQIIDNALSRILNFTQRQ